MRAIAIELDALGDTRRLWDDWLADAARRYRAIAPLDVAALPHDRGEAAKRLDRWAQAGVGDWRGALARFAEERAPVYLRPDAAVSRAIRVLHATGTELAVFTDAPAELAELVLAHLGVQRRIVALETGSGARERLVQRLGGAAVVTSAEELALQAGSAEPSV